MNRKIIILFLLLLILPRPSYAQVSSPTSAAMIKQPTNSSSLFKNTALANRYFARFIKRSDAILNRLKKIQVRMERRLTKVDATVSANVKLQTELKSLSSQITSLEQEKSALQLNWDQIVKDNDKGQYPAFKKKMEEFLNKSEVLINRHKSLLKELKKFKNKAEPTQKVATQSDINN